MDAGKPNPESVIGENDYSMVWADYAELFRVDDEYVITKKKPKLNFEESQTTPKGEKIWHKTSKVPLLDSNDRVFGVLGTYEDITEKKKLELNLIKHHEELEFLVNDRTHDLEVAYWELQSINEKLNNQRNELEATLESLHAAQNQLIQSEKMASIGILTAGIAHEINNPINFISSGIAGLEMEIHQVLDAVKEYNELCQKFGTNKEGKLFERVDERHNVRKALDNIPKLIQSIRTGVNRTTSIVKGLRTFSRLEDENKTAVNLNEIINSALTILYNKYKHSITVSTNFCENDSINCFAGKLGQLFLNILMNSIQAISGEGTIDIKTEYLKEKDVYKIVIKDSGIGIPNDLQQKVFDPFFTTKPVGIGTGLGLSIVLGIVKDHKGDIKLQSEEEKGTEISLILPKS
jgi:signal transduction histidine kinase